MLGLLKVIKIGWNISTLLNIINKFQSNTRKMIIESRRQLMRITNAVVVKLNLFY